MNNQNKATYALLADNVYWDTRKGGVLLKEQKNSNWTPVPEGWTVIDEVSGSGSSRDAHKELDGFTARVFKNTDTNEVVISFAGTYDAVDWISGNVPLASTTLTDDQLSAMIG